MFKYIQDLKGIENKEGRKIKPNLLYRSSEFFNMTPRTIKYLCSFELKKIIDLRQEDEIKERPDYKFKNCVYHYYSILENNITGVTHLSNSEKLEALKKMETMEETYIKFFNSKHCLNEFKKSIRDIVLGNEFPLDWHCATGKDRAGILTMLILEVLDVKKETIMKVYQYTYMKYIFKAYYLFCLTFIVSFDLKLAFKARDMYRVSLNLINASYQTIEKNFGSVSLFIKDYCEISDEEKERFKNLILE